MLNSEKFLFVIPVAGESDVLCDELDATIYMCLFTAVIESLDQMKKGRENYSAREAIKFLESQLKSGSKFIRAQKPTETLMEGKARKPSKMDLDVW